jgi:hypothetical protein
MLTFSCTSHIEKQTIEPIITSPITNIVGPQNGLTFHEHVAQCPHTICNTWSASLEHPNNIHRYAKTCHLGTTSNSTSSCQWGPMVSSLLELGF